MVTLWTSCRGLGCMNASVFGKGWGYMRSQPLERPGRLWLPGLNGVSREQGSV